MKFFSIFVKNRKKKRCRGKKEKEENAFEEREGERAREKKKKKKRTKKRRKRLGYGGSQPLSRLRLSHFSSSETSQAQPPTSSAKERIFVANFCFKGFSGLFSSSFAFRKTFAPLL